MAARIPPFVPTRRAGGALVGEWGGSVEVSFFSAFFFLVFWVWCFLFLACTLWRAGLGPGRSGGSPLVLHTG